MADNINLTFPRDTTQPCLKFSQKRQKIPGNPVECTLPATAENFAIYQLESRLAAPTMSVQEEVMKIQKKLSKIISPDNQVRVEYQFSPAPA